MQTGGVVESWARREILGAVASAIDAGALSGTGGVQPLGIANSALVQTITFGGAATREKLLEMEANVANAHAPDSNVVFVASPTVRKKLKSAPASPSVDYLWTDAGTVVGRPAFASTNAPGSRIICGAFTHYSVAMFGMLDILVNPFNEDATGNVRVSINAFADCGELYPKSFCVSTDDANQ
jgi:HK97 family phage major capsid protein